MLGLVAMATNVDSLYAAMKAMVCIVGNNSRALKEMERTGGFQVSKMEDETDGRERSGKKRGREKNGGGGEKCMHMYMYASNWYIQEPI